MKRLLISLITILSIAVVVTRFSSAFFSDTETSTGNILAAGSIDLKIDNTSYYNHATSSATTWTLADLTVEKFFDFRDVKPGDTGEDTISVHVNDNDSWLCADVTLTGNDDNGLTTPESVAGDTTDGAGNGELANHINFLWWADDGDNVLEDNETVLPGGPLGTLGIGQSALVRLADSTGGIWGGGPLPGGVTKYIGKAWCFGSLVTAALAQDNLGPESTRTPANSTGGVTCDGSNESNETQSDRLTADISFRAVQSRHNPNFVCGQEETPTPTPIGITPTLTPTPTPLACQQSDVMLVLDRSGSINSTELSQLKTAAKAFVDALGLTPTGIHAGKSSFATTATLNHHLTDNDVSLKASIDAMVSGGFTNLKEGIDLAAAEMANPGDGHDRTDATSPDKMIVITDGHPNRPLPSSTADDLAATAADNARSAGSEIYVVGVGSDVNTTYLTNEIADDPSHYYSASDYSGLQTTLENLDLCD